MSRDYAGLWVYRTGGDGSRDEAQVTLSGLSPGKYTVMWWDIDKGVPTGSGTVKTNRDGNVVIQSPPVLTSIAAYLVRGHD